MCVPEKTEISIPKTWLKQKTSSVLQSVSPGGSAAVSFSTIRMCEVEAYGGIAAAAKKARSTRVSFREIGFSTLGITVTLPSLISTFTEKVLTDQTIRSNDWCKVQLNFHLLINIEMNVIKKNKDWQKNRKIIWLPIVVGYYCYCLFTSKLNFTELFSIHSFPDPKSKSIENHM